MFLPNPGRSKCCKQQRLLGQSFPLSLAAWFNKSFRRELHTPMGPPQLVSRSFISRTRFSCHFGMENWVSLPLAPTWPFIFHRRDAERARPRFAVVTCKLRFFKKSSRSLAPCESHLIKLRFIGAATLPGIKASGKSAVAGGKFGLMEKLFLRLNGIPTKKLPGFTNLFYLDPFL